MTEPNTINLVELADRGLTYILAHNALVDVKGGGMLVTALAIAYATGTLILK